MKKLIFSFFLIIGLTSNGFTQLDMQYARKMVDTLASPNFFGRGYVKEGDELASYFIATEFVKAGLSQFAPAPSFYQVVKFNVNTFPADPFLAFDHLHLYAGLDYLPHPDCPSVVGTYQITWLDSTTVSNPGTYKDFARQDFSNTFIVIDSKGVTDESLKKIFKNMELNPYGAKGLIYIKDKLTHSVATQLSPFPAFDVLRGKVSRAQKTVRLNVLSEFFPNYPSQNVIGYVWGKEVTDTFIVFSAHYDHLGRIGNRVLFPGANDNASGISMLLSLARHYAKPENKPKYSIAFIAFGGEEAGLLGSQKYIQEPIIPLKQIKFLMNMDIMGTGDEGATVVNATEFPTYFQKLDSINTSGQLLPALKKRGKAANSDHYFFSENGVPAFFIYTNGGIKAYHDIYDRPQTLPLTKFPQVFELLTKFVSTF